MGKNVARIKAGITGLGGIGATSLWVYPPLGCATTGLLLLFGEQEIHPFDDCIQPLGISFALGLFP
jgi:hypothetical protein